MNSGGDTRIQFIAGAQQLLPAEHLRWTSWGTSEMKLGASRGLKSPVADMTLDGTLSSPCSLCCKCTGRLPATHTVAFSCSLPAPHPQPYLPMSGSFSALGLVLCVPSLSSLPTNRERPLWPHCIPAPVWYLRLLRLSLSVSHLLIVHTHPSGGTSSVWFMAVDHGAGTEQALANK